jgi:peroxiredoxin
MSSRHHHAGIRVVAGFIGLAIAMAPPARFSFAQDAGGAPAAAAGHSMHGEAFNEGPRQAAYLMGGTGRVKFPVSTSAPEAQAFFDQGIGQLHGFWYFEAERSFRQVAAIDPKCRMAYLGMAMANHNNEKRAKEFIEKAAGGAAAVSRREALWIDGFTAYHRADAKESRKRRQALVRSLEGIIHEFPEDLEAKAFLVCYLWHFKGDLPFASHEAVNALLDQIFAVEPMHPAHHYRIHLWDYERPERALQSAARCGQSAPSVAHMWHMSGHIYSRLERYADAAWEQEASSRVDHARMMRDRVLPDQIHNYSHNQEWLIRDLLNIGRVRDGIALAKNLIELPRHPKFNALGKPGHSATFGRERLLQALMRFELWEELLALSETSYLEPSSAPAEELKRLRAIGAACGELGNSQRLASLRRDLDERRAVAEKSRDEAMSRASETAVAAGKTPEEVQAAKDESAREANDRIREIEEAVNELALYQSLLAGEPQACAEALKSVKGIDKERLARLHLRAGDLESAERLARESRDQGPKEVDKLANFIDVLLRCGKREEAGYAFAELRALSANLELELPVLRRLAPLARQLAGKDDWRVAAIPAPDLGVRPELDNLGPLRWQPSAAPSWSLTDGAGKRVALEDYAGRAVLVIFYLGHGCLHCVEQLNAFGPRAGEFEEIGVALAAISSEEPAALSLSIEKFARDKGAIPFPLVSNPGLEVFKAYRAYDDFEKQPLHGTFLIDGLGRVRWQDISYEPFMDAEFLLGEAKRLLSSGPGRRGRF